MPASSAPQDTVHFPGTRESMDTGDVELIGPPDPLHFPELHRAICRWNEMQGEAVVTRSRLDAAAGRLTPFVGREIELAILVDRWERVQDGEGQVVVVIGEAGVGKSRLVYQLRERVRAECSPGAHVWLETGATSCNESTPFRPIIGLVSSGLKLSPRDSSATKLGKVERGLGSLASPATVALLADFVGIPPPLSVGMSAKTRRRRTMDILVEWLLELSAERPVVAVVEDIHLCDPSSLELLSALAARIAAARVLLLATARPGHVPTWSDSAHATCLMLSPLKGRHVRDMIDAIGDGKWSADSLRALVSRSEGLPLYVEQHTRAAMERGVEPADDGELRGLGAALVPRLDRLTTAKEVAQCAAVLGCEFQYGLLASVLDKSKLSLCDDLRRLVDAGIVFAQGRPPAATYTFSHALFQRVAYTSLSETARQHVHRRVLDVLMTEFPERVVSEPEVVAYHAERAKRIASAIDFYQRAGERDQARSAHEEAIQHFRRATALIGTLAQDEQRDAREAEVQLGLASSLAITQGFAHSDVEAAYERVRVLCQAAGEVGRLGLAHIGLSFFCSTRGQLEHGRRFADQVLLSALHRGDKQLALHGHLQVAICEHYQGSFRSVLNHCEQALRLYEAGRHHGIVSMLAGDPGVVALSYAAWSSWMLGLSERASGYVRDAEELANRLDDVFSLVLALFFGSALDWLTGDIESMRSRTTRVIELSERHGFQLWSGLGKTFNAAARERLGTPTEITAELGAGITDIAATGTLAAAPVLYALLTESHLVAKRLVEAYGAVEAGMSIAAATAQGLWNAELLRLRGEIARLSGDDHAEVEAFFVQSLQIARAQEARSFELRAATSLAALWAERGQPDRAHAVLAPVYASFVEGSATNDLVTAKALLASLSGGDPQSAPR